MAILQNRLFNSRLYEMVKSSSTRPRFLHLHLPLRRNKAVRQQAGATQIVG